MEQNEKDLIKGLGKQLKALRENRNISLNMFAYENDMTTATVSRVENGLVDLKFTTLFKYARALEIPLEDILVKLNIDYSNNKYIKEL